MTIQDFQNILAIIKSQQKYSNFVYFENYLRISVSIGTSAKCKSYMVMLLKADTVFSKTKVIYSLDMLSSFIQVILFLPSKIVFYGVQRLKGKRVLFMCGIVYPP